MGRDTNKNMASGEIFGGDGDGDNCFSIKVKLKRSRVFYFNIISSGGEGGFFEIDFNERLVRNPDFVGLLFDSV